MKKILLKAIKIYQKTLSPDHGLLQGTSMMRCRYYPSCSEYGYRAIDKHGVIKGGSKTIIRIARCNPLFAGGVDESYI